MKQLVKGFTNDELLGKIDNEGIEYFFLSYIDVDSIQDVDLRKAVQQFKLAFEEIESFIDEIADDEDS
jgi:hypothetical protein